MKLKNWKPQKKICKECGHYDSSYSVCSLIFDKAGQKKYVNWWDTCHLDREKKEMNRG